MNQEISSIKEEELIRHVEDYYNNHKKVTYVGGGFGIAGAGGVGLATFGIISGPIGWIALGLTGIGTIINIKGRSHTKESKEIFEQL